MSYARHIFSFASQILCIRTFCKCTFCTLILTPCILLSDNNVWREVDDTCQSDSVVDMATRTIRVEVHYTHMHIINDVLMIVNCAYLWQPHIINRIVYNCCTRSSYDSGHTISSTTVVTSF